MKKPSPPPKSEVDEFRKGGIVAMATSAKPQPSSKPVGMKKPSPPPKSQGDEFRKVGIVAVATSAASATKPQPPIKSADVKKPSPPPKSQGDEFRKVGIVAMATSSKVPPPDKPAPVIEKRTSSMEGFTSQALSGSPTGSPLRKGRPPALPEKPAKEFKRMSPKHPSEPVLARKGQSDDDNMSTMSNSSLASLSSRSLLPTESPRDHSPASGKADEQDLSHLEKGSRVIDPSSSSVSLGELDDIEPSPRFRSRSSAIKANPRARSSSPGVSHQQQEEKKPEAETVSDDFDDSQPRVRSRSGAVDSHTPRGRNLSNRGSQEDDEDVFQPRLRTRSRALHGDSQRPKGLGRRGSQEETHPTNDDDDMSQPRLRTRSRALRGDQQRPRRFIRTASPLAKGTQSALAASLDVPDTSSRPRSSSTGHYSQANPELGRMSPGPKPDGEQ